VLHSFSPRGLPPLCGREHVAVAAEHFRPLQVAIDFQPHFSSERVSPKLTRGAESLVAAHFVDAEQLSGTSRPDNPGRRLVGAELLLEELESTVVAVTVPCCLNERRCHD